MLSQQPFLIRTRKILVAIGLLVFSAAPAVSEDRPSDGAVRVLRCRVLLIDQVTLASEVSGILAEVPVEEGDRVEARDLVAGLKRESAAAALAVADRQAADDFEWRYAKKAAELATSEFERTKTLFKKNVVSESEYERARLEAERAALLVEKAESQSAINLLLKNEKRAQFDAFVVRTPISGRVTRVFRRPGEAVRQGDPILEIVSSRRLRVEGEVPASEANRVHAGDRATAIVLDEDGRELSSSFPARVVFVDDAIEPNSRTVRVWAEAPNPESRLKAGQTANLVITPGRGSIAGLGR